MAGRPAGRVPPEKAPWEAAGRYVWACSRGGSAPGETQPWGRPYEDSPRNCFKLGGQQAHNSRLANYLRAANRQRVAFRGILLVEGDRGFVCCGGPSY